MLSKEQVQAQLDLSGLCTMPIREMDEGWRRVTLYVETCRHLIDKDRLVTHYLVSTSNTTSVTKKEWFAKLSQAALRYEELTGE